MSQKLSFSSYSELLDFIFSQRQGVGLETLKKLCRELSSPEKSYKIVHVGGTNGKGSVSTKIAKALEKEGYRCALYTSPHIECFRERIQINGEKIPEEAVLRLGQNLLNRGFRLSFFEITTLIALSWFAEQKVDWAVIEVGLGGRLDATNLVQPELAVITSIGLDHTEILGETLQQILEEKKGIFKPGIPRIIGPKVPPVEEALQPSGEYTHYDEENGATARLALEQLSISEPSIAYGLSFRPPCRQEWLTPTLLLDVAHNPDGMRALAELLQGRKAHFLIAFSKTKDASEALKPLLPLALSFTFTQTENHPFHLSETLKKMALDLGYIGPLECAPSPAEALSKRVLSQELVVVTGSFYIMSEVKKWFLRACIKLLMPLT